MTIDVVSRARVLVADAQASDRALVAEILQAEGCRVDEALDAFQTWAKLRLQHYDLVVLDARLPLMSGLDLLRLMRRLDPFPLVVVVFDSPSPPLERIAHSLGARWCDRKPVELDRLVKTVRQPEFARTD